MNNLRLLQVDRGVFCNETNSLSEASFVTHSI